MTRKMAHIETIKNIVPIENADAIECAHVLDWELVVKKGEFQIGDKCVYVEIDSILPQDNLDFEFMQPRHYEIWKIFV